MTDIEKELSKVTDPGAANSNTSSARANAANAANSFGRDANGIRQDANQTNSITTQTQFGILSSASLINGTPNGGMRPIAPATGVNSNIAPKGSSPALLPATPAPPPTTNQLIPNYNPKPSGISGRSPSD